MDHNKLRPESLMMSYGYKPELSQGAVKCPIFQTSTFVFQKAEDGKAFFEVAYGLRERSEGEELGLIYSRLNNPDLEILEDRLGLWEEAGDCAVFESGMSAITTVLLEFLSPGDLLLFSNPIYGGTDHFIKHILTRFGVEVLGFYPWEQDRLEEIVRKSGKADRLRMVYVETPANPTNILIDIAACSRVAKQFSTAGKPVLLAVDNTYMGPLWQHPMKQGADLVLYSATKYIGGHSDVIAGACLGSKELMARVKGLRSFLGCMAGPWTGWLLLRSLETLKPRMETQARGAAEVAAFLKQHPKVKKVHYLGFLEDPAQQAIFKGQCHSAGAMLSFDVHGGEPEAFRFLNALKLVKLAVSLGSTESLAEHPATMTHVGVDPAEREKLGITGGLVRLSVGVEHPQDLIADLEQALQTV
ncbi:MAG: cystathionine gamma-synthase family protein [Flavobacteriales bacterium]|nr:cystathionine gamma-synthase family protein [Flavobacteriales bacterium]MBP9078784.1 cystathionine gamma-synthase family protein [Flavobacteriales bacterium]